MYLMNNYKLTCFASTGYKHSTLSNDLIRVLEIFPEHCQSLLPDLLVDRKWMVQITWKLYDKKYL